MRLLNPAMSRCSPSPDLATVFPGDLASSASHLSGGTISVMLWIVIFFQVGVTIGKCLVDSLVQILLLDALLNMLVAAGASNCVWLSSLWRLDGVLSGGEHELG